MIKLTNSQLSMFNSPTVRNLFNSPDRTFPIEDAFALHALIEELQPKMKVYAKLMRQLLEKFGANPLPDGTINMIKVSQEDRKTLQEEIEKLNSVEIEIQGETVTMKPEWPSLTLGEVTILRPLINVKRTER